MTGVLEVRGGGGGGSGKRSSLSSSSSSSSSPPLSIPLDVVTLYDPSSGSYRQRVSYHRGLEVDYRVNGTSYKMVHRNGGTDRICMRANGTGEEDLHIVNFFPSPGELKLYQDRGVVTSDPGVPYVLLTRNASHGGWGGYGGGLDGFTTAGVGGMPPDDHFEFRIDAVGMDPVQWRMLSRNKLESAHTDDWVMKYQSFEPIAGDRERELHVALFDDEFPDACRSDNAMVDVSAGVGGVNFNRLGMIFSSSPPFRSSPSSSSSLYPPPSSMRLGRLGADEEEKYEVSPRHDDASDSGAESASDDDDESDRRVEYDDSFYEFLATRGGSYYRSPEEASKRWRIYRRNVERIRELNDLHRGRPGREGATFRPYPRFLDMDVDEVLTYHGGLRRPRHHRQDMGSQEGGGLFPYYEMPTPESDDELSSSPPLPDSFDWREHMPGSVGPVKDQGICGSCWAFSLVGSIESHWYIHRGHRPVTLPEQFVVDCTWGGLGGNAGCDGGWEEEGAAAILDRYNGSIPTREAYGGYLSVDGRCYVDSAVGGDDIPGRPSDFFGTSNVRIDGWTRVPSRDEEAVKRALYHRGPLSVSINVVDALVYYSSGVVDVDECKRNGPDDLDHAVVLVGWGSNNNNTTNDEDEGDGGGEGKSATGSGGRRGGKRKREHWILRNSWSTLWGDDGYFRIAMGENDCGVTTAAGFPVVAEGIDKDVDSDLGHFDVDLS